MNTDFNDFISNTERNESYMLYDNLKVIKLIGKSQIYFNHVRNTSEDIYINSVTIECTYQTLDTHYISHDIENMKLFWNEMENTIKNDYYLLPKFCDSYMGAYNMLEDTKNNICKFSTVNKNMFICTHTGQGFAHEIAYMWPQIYFYIIIKKIVPDLVLVIKYKTYFIDFLIKTLNIEYYILQELNEEIINEGTTYFANHLTCNLGKDICINFFNNMIVKNTLLSCEIDTTNMPKKILFLRNATNTNPNTGGHLNNRECIVSLCEKYGYVDIDQTELPLEKVICMVNNATHIVCEAGGSMLHLLWNINIKPIILATRTYTYYNTLAAIWENTHEYYKIISDNIFTDIATITNAKVIYDDGDYNLLTNLESKEDTDKNTFINLDSIDKALQDPTYSNVESFW